MNAVGIDVSKGKSMIAIVQPFGVVVAEPFEVSHDVQSLSGLVERLKRLHGETKAVMEYTGTYYEPIANALRNAGIFVSVVNPLLIDDYGTNRVRKVKTDKKDAFKIANYALDKWTELREYIPADDIRKTLKIMNRQYIKKNHYNYTEETAAEIHAYSRTRVSTLPMTDSVTKLVTETVSMLNSTLETLSTLRKEINNLSSQLPEYEAVMDLYGVGKVFCSQLIADIGDVRRLKSSKSLVALAGIDPPPNQSGQNNPKSRSISKRGSPTLRKTLFQIMTVIIKNKPADDPVYQFLDRKRSEGKPYRVYMIAAANKFLRIYYARVMQALS